MEDFGDHLFSGGGGAGGKRGDQSSPAENRDRLQKIAYQSTVNEGVVMRILQSFI